MFLILQKLKFTERLALLGDLVNIPDLKSKLAQDNVLRFGRNAA